MPCDIKTIRDIKRYPFIKQNTNTACIPACIEAVVKYHDLTCKVDQDEIIESFGINVGKLSEINFGNVSELLNKFLLNDSFHFDRITEDDFDKWMKIIRANVDLNCPPLISTRLRQGGAHILAVVGYGNDFLRVHDPSSLLPPQFLDKDLGEMAAIRACDILTITPTKQVEF